MWHVLASGQLLPTTTFSSISLSLSTHLGCDVYLIGHANGRLNVWLCCGPVLALKFGIYGSHLPT